MSENICIVVQEKAQLEQMRISSYYAWKISEETYSIYFFKVIDLAVNIISI